jgi:hypothetical protein
MGKQLPAVPAVLIGPEPAGLPGAYANKFVLPEPGNGYAAGSIKHKHIFKFRGRGGEGLMLQVMLCQVPVYLPQSPLILRYAGIEVMAVYPELHAA